MNEEINNLEENKWEAKIFKDNGKIRRVTLNGKDVTFEQVGDSINFYQPHSYSYDASTPALDWTDQNIIYQTSDKTWEERFMNADFSQDWEMASSYLDDYLDYGKLRTFIQRELTTATIKAKDLGYTEGYKQGRFDEMADREFNLEEPINKEFTTCKDCNRPKSEAHYHDCYPNR